MYAYFRVWTAILDEPRKDVYQCMMHSLSVIVCSYSGVVSEPSSEVASPGENRCQFQRIATPRRRHKFVVVAHLPRTASDVIHMPPTRRQVTRLPDCFRLARLQSSLGHRATHCSDVRSLSSTSTLGSHHSRSPQFDVGSQFVCFQTRGTSAAECWDKG